MSRRKTLTDIGVAALRPRPRRYSFADPEMRGLFVRVQPSGSKAFCAVARDPTGKQVWATVAATDLIGIGEARDRARDTIKRVKAGLPPVEPAPIKPDSFKAVTEAYIKRHLIGRGARTANEIQRIFQRYVLPQWADHDFTAIRRSDVVRLLDKIEDENGAAMADKVLTVTRALFNWFAVRSDDYLPPVSRGMRRTDHTRRRNRILDDAELRAVWARAGEQGRFGAFVKLLLLTAQRRSALASMRWGDLVDGVWHMPTEDRQKSNAGALKLPRAALDIIAAQLRINDYVFAGRGEGHLRGYVRAKGAFDAGLPEMPRWTLHDLRRTSRSLMSRAGVASDHAERVMGHVIAGVEGVYDRHSYRDEKADALKRLAALIERIINPPADNIVPLAGVAR